MPKRSGDHNFHPIDENKIPKNLKKVKHGKTYVFGIGEASNHMHIMVADREDLLEITEDENGVQYYNIKADCKMMHTVGNSMQVADHKTITITPGWYVHVPERELDIFTNVARKVID